MCDKIKACRWYFFEFLWVVHYREIYKINVKNKGTSFSRGQKIKNITKIEQKRAFLFTFLVSFFFGVSRTKTN